MATGWQSNLIELKGGLVSNLSRLQHGAKAPGSARVLTNFEPSVKGGYRRINGFNKFSPNPVPGYGETKVQGSGQTGSTLLVANLFESPVIGDSFSVDGVSGTYTITSVTYSFSGKSATLSLSPSLASSPADKASITFEERDTRIEGLKYFYSTQNRTGTCLVVRDGALWAGSGGVWTNESAPNYGATLEVSGGSQTGSTLAVDGVLSDDKAPNVGDTFTVDGIEKVYTVTTVSAVSAGAVTLGISPALASSPADNADITFLSTSMSGGTLCRFNDFNFDGTEKVVFVDGANYPMTWGLFEGLTVLSGTVDVKGSTVVAPYKNHMFFGNGSSLIFSAPFAQNDFSAGSGAGTIVLPHEITGLIIFREKLIVFTESSIHQVSGSSSSDFTLTNISDELGCSEPDTIQEVGGDIMFLGPDGLRLLGATARIGDFSLGLASRAIQDELSAVTSGLEHLTSLVVRDKSQYRVLGCSFGQSEGVSYGFIGVQFSDQEASGFSWSKTEGIKAYRTTSTVTGSSEVIQFVGETGYVYNLESGNDFDGTSIVSYYSTPFMAINDPRIRKTLYKATTYYDPEGSVTGSLSFRYDFEGPNVIQPEARPLAGGGNFTFFGSSVFGSGNFGGTPNTVLETPATGSFFTVSLQYEFTGESEPPFVIDTILLEYSDNDRK